MSRPPVPARDDSGVGDVPVVVADSSKVGTVADFSIAPIEAATILVTDSGLDDEYRAELADLGVQVVVADDVVVLPTSASV